MKIVLDGVPPDQMARGLSTARTYVAFYMHDGRSHGQRNCVIFTRPDQPDMAAWHSKTGHVTVRMTGGNS